MGGSQVVILFYHKPKNNMGKNTEIKLVGKPIFSQVLKLIDKGSFERQLE